MGFHTELFSRPRPQEEIRYRPSLVVLLATNSTDRFEFGTKPADFPRIGRSPR